MSMKKTFEGVMVEQEANGYLQHCEITIVDPKVYRMNNFKLVKPDWEGRITINGEGIDYSENKKVRITIETLEE